MSSNMLRMGKRSALLLVICVFLLDGRSLAQLSNPIAHDDNMKEIAANNKFLQREATDDARPMLELDEEALANTQCPQNLELRWQTEVGSSIYATPLIADINGDGKLEIVVPTFVHYLEVLDGADGEKLPGWPVQHQSTVHASALLYDIDNDGNKEIVLPTFNGEVLFFRHGGYLLPEKLIIPRFKVKKNWYVGLDPDHVDRRNPDVHDASLVEENIKHGPQMKQDPEAIRKEEVGSITMDSGTGTEKPSENTTSDNQSTVNLAGSMVNDTTSNETLSESLTADNPTTADDATAKSSENVTSNSTSTPGKNNTASDVNDIIESVVESTINKVGSTGGIEDILANTKSQEAQVRRRLLQDGGTSGDGGTTVKENPANVEAGTTDSDSVPTAENPEDPMEDDALASFDVFREEEENLEDELTEEYDYDYDDYVNEGMWGDEDWSEKPHERLEEFVSVDSHILSTPVIADIDKDGVDEMVIAASYFYDREYYEMAEHSKELGDNVDITKYITGAIVVFNLQTKQVKWEIQLDLSTDTPAYRAYIYSPPTVVDLDGDGYLEIIVGTSMGFLYVFEHNGSLKKKFPLLMGEIQGQVVAADINDDGKIEIVTVDSKGNVAAWTGEGDELWEVHLKSLVSQGPTVGDVDGDGHTDLVVPTTSGNIYVLRGSDGTKVLPHPFRTHGRVMAPALLVDLSKRGAERKGLTIAVGSFDGYFYLIDGPTGCAEAIDIGETTYSMALADNVDGGDDLDIIVTTMNGNVFCFQTPAAHHPLKAWPMLTQGRNVFSSRHQREGIFVVPSSREFRDEAGDSFHVTFEIVDKYLPSSGTLGPYQVTVTLLTPGNYRGDKRTRFNYTYEQPGVYTVKLPCLPTRIGGTVALEMLDKNSLYFSDEFSLTFHMRYYRLLKWLLTLPFLGMTGMFLLLRPQEGAPLPSFTRERHQL